MEKNESVIDKKMLLAEDEKLADRMNKWKPILEAEGYEPIADESARQFTVQMLEAQMENAGLMNEAAGSTTTGNMAIYDPVAIAMLRRAAPYMIAPKVMGVAPLTQPTGLVFALRSRYTDKNGAEALFNEANSGFSGAGGDFVGGVLPPLAGKVATQQDSLSADVVVDSVEGLVPGVFVVADGIPSGTYIKSINAGEKKITLSSPTVSQLQAEAVLGYATGYGTAMETSKAEGDIMAKMSFTIERVRADAGVRQLAAGWSIEIEQDLKRVHGLSAFQIISDIMSTELLAETNREVVRSLYNSAMVGAMNSATPGVFDIDNADGRWLGERLKALVFQTELESNAVAISTRRGRANVMICSPNVAAGFAAAGSLSYNKLNTQMLGGDFTTSTYMGKLNGMMDVYVDPYATSDFILVGYRGATQSDCGAFFCPYIPLQMYEGKDPESFQPRVGIKSRYAMLSNPFNDTEGKIMPRTNTYYRVFNVKGI